MGGVCAPRAFFTAERPFAERPAPSDSAARERQHAAERGAAGTSLPHMCLGNVTRRLASNPACQDTERAHRMSCIFLRGGTCRCAVALQISTCNNNMPSCRSRHAGALATLAWHDAVVHAQFNANCVSLVLVNLGACRSAAARTRRAAAADGRGTPGGGARSYLRAGAVAEFRVRRRPGTSRPRTCVRGRDDTRRRDDSPPADVAHLRYTTPA